METESSENAVKQVAIRLPEPLWRRLRILAARRDSSTTEVASGIIEKYLAREEAKQ